MIVIKCWVIVLLIMGFVGCGNPKEEQRVVDELVIRPAVTIKNPTSLQRACKNFIYQTPPTFPVPIADSVLNGYELSLCVSLLAGEDPNQKNDQGESLLQIAHKITDSNKQARVVEILKAAGAK